MDDEESRAEAEAWLAKAQQDLEAAGLIEGNGGPFTVGCFLCQQAIEKLLKALLVLAGDLPPRTHDLADLHRRLGERGADLALDPGDLVAWTPYAVVSRYPGFGDPHADTDFPALLAAARGLFGQARQLVSGGA